MLNLLNKSRILAALHPQTRSILSQLECLDCIDSTNNHLLKKINLRHPKILACFAEQQTAGKGRRGRQWLSPYGHNIYHSLLYYFNQAPSELLGLSVIIAVLVARALKRFGIKQGLELKWPNDILWGNKKLGGILIELASKPQIPCAVVIGVGINTRLPSNQTARPLSITSTEEILGQPSDRNHLATLLLDALVAGLQQFQEIKSKPFIEEWHSMAAYRGQLVKLSSPQQEVIARMEGLSDQGALLLVDSKGKKTAYLSGALSLRPIE